MNFAMNVVPLIAGIALLAFPDFDTPALETKIEDGVWESLAHVAGPAAPLVTKLKESPFVADMVHLAITKELAAAQAELYAEASEAPAAFKVVESAAENALGAKAEGENSVASKAEGENSVVAVTTEDIPKETPLVLGQEQA